jgi:hypothetical protein
VSPTVITFVGVTVGARGHVEVDSSEVDDATALDDALIDADEAAALIDVEVVAVILEAPEVAGTGFEFETTPEALLGSTLDPVLDLRVMTVVAVVAAWVPACVRVLVIVMIEG